MTVRRNRLITIILSSMLIVSTIAVYKVYSSLSNDALPTIYVITPTYARHLQEAKLTQLCNLFLNIPKLHWILIEDSNTKTDLVSNFLDEKCNIKYTHLNITSSANLKRLKGINQRNEGLNWIRKNVHDINIRKDGVLYFADDDNTYSVKLFNEMRYTKTISVWPVGLVGGVIAEKPIVSWDKLSGSYKVSGWDVGWAPNRLFPIDMAGFAVNLELFLNHPKAKFSSNVKPGFQEPEFLKHFNIKMNDLEPKADQCTQVYVWHTKDAPPNLVNEKKKLGKNE